MIATAACKSRAMSSHVSAIVRRAGVSTIEVILDICCGPAVPQKPAHNSRGSSPRGDYIARTRFPRKTNGDLFSECNAINARKVKTIWRGHRP